MLYVMARNFKNVRIHRVAGAVHAGLVIIGIDYATNDSSPKASHLVNPNSARTKRVGLPIVRTVHLFRHGLVA